MRSAKIMPFYTKVGFFDGRRKREVIEGIGEIEEIAFSS